MLSTAAAFQFCAVPLQVYGGLLVPILNLPIAEGGKFGWSADWTGASMAAFYLVAGLLAPLCAAFSDRWGGRAVLLAIATLYSLGMLLMAVVHSQWHFFVVYSVLLSLVFTMSLGPLLSLILPWFSRQLGLGVGILWLAGALGATGLLPVLAFLLETVGWTTAFLAFGLVGGGVMFPLALLYGRIVQTRRPPIIEGNAAWVERQAVKAREWLVSTQVRNTRAYWNLPILHGLGCGGHGIILVYLIDLLVHDGFTCVGAALVLAVSQAFAIPSRLLGPVIAQHTDGRTLMSAVLALQGLSALALLFTHDMAALCLVAAVFGLAYGSESSVYPVVNRRYFGDRISSGVYGRQLLGGLVGQSLAVVTAGLLINHLGYVAGFGLAIALNFVGFGLVWGMESTKAVLVSEDAPMPVSGGPG